MVNRYTYPGSSEVEYEVTCSTCGEEIHYFLKESESLKEALEKDGWELRESGSMTVAFCSKHNHD